MSDGSDRNGERCGVAAESPDHDGGSQLPLPGIPAGLAALLHRAEGSKKPAPVERWEPAFCGDLDMRIASDGTWFYMGTPIGREALVHLFATVLRKDDDGRTYLVTPVEKVGITVDDAPFLAVEMAREAVANSGDGPLVFRTNLGAVVKAGGDHPLRFELEEATHGLKAYLLVRGRLEALVTRALMYDLIAMAAEGTGPEAGRFGIRSGESFFAICAMKDLEMLEDLE
nr:DUF1285 domain-containing protein [uncultured Cohaesibacter sp.]